MRSFIDALTGVGNIKGIELIGSADPARYIGDMLAWIHQAVPSERENLMILLKKCNKIGILCIYCLLAVLSRQAS